MTKKEIVVNILGMLKKHGVELGEGLLELVQHSKYIDDKIIDELMMIINDQITLCRKKEDMNKLYIGKQMLLDIRQRERYAQEDADELLNNL